MMTDFSEDNLYMLSLVNTKFLLQCPKTKIIYRMRIGEVNRSNIGHTYYVGIANYSDGRNCLYVRVANRSTACFESFELSKILRTKNFSIRK